MKTKKKNNYNLEQIKIQVKESKKERRKFIKALDRNCPIAWKELNKRQNG